MTFTPLVSNTADPALLRQEYDSGRAIGVIRLGKEHLLFKKMWKVYYMAYTDMDRVFRRVQLVPAKLCCGKGEFQIENLVLCHDENEVAMIQLPGLKAAEALMAELKKRAPHARFGKPETREEESTIGDPTGPG